MNLTCRCAQSLVCSWMMVLLAGCSGQSGADPIATPVKPAFYTVDHYDPSRDPHADLAMTIERASRENKRIFVQVGGNWCRWCALMSKFIENSPGVRAALEQGYLLMKVHYSPEQPNEDFLSQFPERPGYPHVFILDTNGTLVHSQATAELEAGEGYDEGAYLGFLEKWGPER